MEFSDLVRVPPLLFLAPAPCSQENKNTWCGAPEKNWGDLMPDQGIHRVGGTFLSILGCFPIQILYPVYPDVSRVSSDVSFWCDRILGYGYVYPTCILMRFECIPNQVTRSVGIRVSQVYLKCISTYPDTGTRRDPSGYVDHRIPSDTSWIH